MDHEKQGVVVIAYHEDNSAVASQLAAELRRLGHQPRLRTYHASGYTVTSDSELFRFPAARAWVLITSKAFDSADQVSKDLKAVREQNIRMIFIRHDISVEHGRTVLAESLPRLTPTVQGTDVFLSYAREDLARAARIAEALETCGWHVWWDRSLAAGVSIREEIAHQLDAAKAVVVLWSTYSIKSNWVLDEAQHGQDRKVLVQVLIDPVAPPYGFRQQHNADLTAWDEQVESEAFAVVMAGVSRLVRVR